MIAVLVFLFGLVTLAAPVAADPLVDGFLSLRHAERGNLSLVSPTFAAAGNWTSIPNFVELCAKMPQPCKPGDTLNLAGLGATIESTYLNYGGVQMDGTFSEITVASREASIGVTVVTTGGAVTFPALPDTAPLWPTPTFEAQAPFTYSGWVGVGTHSESFEGVGVATFGFAPAGYTTNLWEITDVRYDITPPP